MAVKEHYSMGSLRDVVSDRALQERILKGFWNVAILTE